MSMRTCVWLAATLGLAACGSDTGTPTTPPPPAADFVLSCQPAGFAAGRGCGSSTCTVTGSNGFAGAIALSCAGQPAGLACEFSPLPLDVADGRPAVAGFMVNAAPGVPAQVHSFEVVAVSGALRRAVSVQVQTGVVAAPSAERDMTLTGCAGYTAGAASTIAQFQRVYVGAWAGGPGQGFCGQTLSEDDGSFVLQIAPRCVPDGAPLFLTAGGLDACRSASFERGGTAHVTLLGRTNGRCP
jgi:hypothetical protein